MFEIRHDEPEYALLNDPQTCELNRYGGEIDLVTSNGLPAGQSLLINGDLGVGTSPNRNKQHGFHFTADNCIGCHACEAACSEKNDLPAHLSFRSVGYVEGGTYPSFTRMNISMACNHCDDPVCLKGCPTGAYTEHPEYGAVIQDPDICFGCGYCTWVCPYNAPQLDPVAGHVEKCNMCVDRLEVGLKPACVSACLGNALDFGVIENVPANREQIKTQIPGFPDPSITQPNIRFEQTRSVPKTFTRTDTQPIKYNGATGHTSVVDPKRGQSLRWGLPGLSSRENPLVLFTLLTQAVVGAFLIYLLMPWLAPLTGLPALALLQTPGIALALLITLALLQAGALFISTQHLGKPLRFYRGFNNLRHSPLSREALAIAVFFAGVSGCAALLLISMVDILPVQVTQFAELVRPAAGWITAAAGLIGLYFMHSIYRIKARPFWNHWQTLTAFFGTMLTLGAVTVGVVAGAVILLTGETPGSLGAVLTGVMAVGLCLEGLGLIFHARDLVDRGGEGAAAHYLQSTVYGKTYWARNTAIAGTIALSVALATAGSIGWLGLMAWAGLAVIAFVICTVGRLLFYVVVIPTTMPGAFFWKNPGFEEHARETGLAAMPQVGVPLEGH